MRRFGAHLGRDVGVGRELLERVPGREREDREEDDADPDEARDRDEQAAEEVLAHRPVFSAARRVVALRHSRVGGIQTGFADPRLRG